MLNHHENADHEHHEHSHEALRSDARLAGRINLISGIAKTVLGFIARSPVLVTDGVHDFGDADTYREDAVAIQESDPDRKAKRKLRAAYKLGGYAVAGTVAEVAVEQLWKRPPIPILSLAGGIASVGLNWWIHRRFAHHDHDEAEEVKGHARTDLYASGITIGASAIGLLWTPALLLGSIAHIGIYAQQAMKVRKKFKSSDKHVI